MSRVRGYFCANRSCVWWKAAGPDENAECRLRGVQFMMVPGGQILVQPIHVSDVAEILLYLARRRGSRSGTYIVAGEPVRLLTFLEFRCNGDWTPPGHFAFAASTLQSRLVLALAARMKILCQLRERVEGLAATSLSWPAGSTCEHGQTQ